MTTQTYAPTGNRRSGIAGRLVALMSVVVFILSVQITSADIPDSASGEFRGMYKVRSSTDPIFPMQANQEWFLDFGKGITASKMSGSVAVSLRENPNVKVRIMSWQYFPKQAAMVIGNPYAEGSRQAVAKGVWQMTATSSGIVWQRGNYQIVLHRADPRDY
jgi:hypothetical protein